MFWCVGDQAKLREDLVEVIGSEKDGRVRVQFESGNTAVVWRYQLKSVKTEDTPTKVKPDGGPSGYYDFPAGAITLNDLLEYKGDKQWLGDSFHLSNVVKAAWRWGDKEGTTKAYDARKFIYSGARLLLKYVGVDELRKTLQAMLDDPQFKPRGPT